MLRDNSRYARLRQVTVSTRAGREVNAVVLRRLPPTAGERHVVAGNDCLDIMAQRQYSDATRFWHVADANTELMAQTLTARVGGLIRVPPR